MQLGGSGVTLYLTLCLWIGHLGAQSYICDEGDTVGLAFILEIFEHEQHCWG